MGSRHLSNNKKKIMATTGHENEAINVEGLKASLQKFKTDKVDVKVDKVTGKGLSTNDYTTNEKNKLAGIAAGAEVNVQSDWNATSGDAFIKNKPTIPSVAQTTGQSTTAVMSQKAVSDLIPAQASASNQLADKDFVNSSVSTATATYQGSYNLVSDLSLTTQASHGQIEDALGNEISGADNNDYVFVQIPTSDSTPTEIASVERYKFNGTRWSFEYTLNNSGFTAEQWAAVNSGITSGLVAKINALSNNPQSSVASLFGMDSSGNFQNISAANLVSVLGVVPMKEVVIIDADNTFTPGIYAGAIGDRYGVFVVLKAREFYAQIHFYGNNSIAVRRNNPDTGRYNEWHFL